MTRSLFTAAVLICFFELVGCGSNKSSEASPTPPSFISASISKNNLSAFYNESDTATLTISYSGAKPRFPECEINNGTSEVCNNVVIKPKSASQGLIKRLFSNVKTETYDVTYTAKPAQQSASSSGFEKNNINIVVTSVDVNQPGEVAVTLNSYDPGSCASKLYVPVTASNKPDNAFSADLYEYNNSAYRRVSKDSHESGYYYGFNEFANIRPSFYFDNTNNLSGSMGSKVDTPDNTYYCLSSTKEGAKPGIPFENFNVKASTAIDGANFLVVKGSNGIFSVVKVVCSSGAQQIASLDTSVNDLRSFRIVAGGTPNNYNFLITAKDNSNNTLYSWRGSSAGSRTITPSPDASYLNGYFNAVTIGSDSTSSRTRKNFIVSLEHNNNYKDLKFSFDGLAEDDVTVTLVGSALPVNSNYKRISCNTVLSKDKMPNTCYLYGVDKFASTANTKIRSTFYIAKIDHIAVVRTSAAGNSYTASVEPPKSYELSPSPSVSTKTFSVQPFYGHQAAYAVDAGVGVSGSPSLWVVMREGIIDLTQRNDSYGALYKYSNAYPIGDAPKSEIIDRQPSTPIDIYDYPLGVYLA